MSLGRCSMAIDIIAALIWLGGFRCAFVDYKAPAIKALFWPFYAGRHMSFYVFAYKSMAQSYTEAQQKRSLH